MEAKVMKTKMILLILLILVTTSVVAAQGNGDQQAETKEAQLGTCNPNNRTVKLLTAKHHNTVVLAETLKGLLSNAGVITHNPHLKTLTVRDCPAGIAVVEQALAKLDVPDPSPANMEFQLHLLAASMTPAEGGAMPKTLEPVITQLKATLKYPHYRYVYSAINRITNGGRIESSGATGELFPLPRNVANNPGNPSFYQYQLNNVKFTQDASGKDAVQIENFRFGITVPIHIGGTGNAQVQYKDIGLVTPLSLREGELAVVGTANIGGSDEAMIVVVSVKKLK
jgi:hypothetical protein